MKQFAEKITLILAASARAVGDVVPPAQERSAQT